jgi:hypothetical protein
MKKEMADLVDRLLETDLESPDGVYGAVQAIVERQESGQCVPNDLVSEEFPLHLVRIFVKYGVCESEYDLAIVSNTLYLMLSVAASHETVSSFGDPGPVVKRCILILTNLDPTNTGILCQTCRLLAFYCTNFNDVALAILSPDIAESIVDIYNQSPTKLKVECLRLVISTLEACSDIPEIDVFTPIFSDLCRLPNDDHLFSLLANAAFAFLQAHGDIELVFQSPQEILSLWESIPFRGNPVNRAAIFHLLIAVFESEHELFLHEFISNFSWQPILDKEWTDDVEQIELGSMLCTAFARSDPMIESACQNGVMQLILDWIFDDTTSVEVKRWCTLAPLIAFRDGPPAAKMFLWEKGLFMRIKDLMEYSQRVIEKTLECVPIVIRIARSYGMEELARAVEELELEQFLGEDRRVGAWMDEMKHAMKGLADVLEMYEDT